MAMDEWARGLAGMTGEQIKRGLDTWKEAWPPSLPEFERACLGHQDGWEHRSAAYKPFPPALPKPKADPAVVAECIARMRQRTTLTPDEIDAARAALRGGR